MKNLLDRFALWTCKPTVANTYLFVVLGLMVVFLLLVFVGVDFQFSWRWPK